MAAVLTNTPRLVLLPPALVQQQRLGSGRLGRMAVLTNTPRLVLLVQLLAALLVLAAPHPAAARYFDRENRVQVYSVPSNLAISALPGHGILSPAGPVSSIKLTMVPLRVEGPLDASGAPRFSYTVTAYRNDLTGVAMPFGPTLRVKRGSAYSIKLTNSLVQPERPSGNPNSPWQNSNSTDETSWLHDPLDTNLHTHGMHAELGVPSQDFAASGAYVAGDNPFFKLPARKSLAQAPATKTFRLRIPSNHLPGLHWYHPHQHGSTIFQAGTAHGLILVEDDNALWLPAANGCSEVASVLSQAVDLLLDIQFHFFKRPNAVNAPLDEGLKEELGNFTTISELTDNLNNGPFEFLSRVALPENELCCDGKGGALNSLTGSATAGRGENVFLVNGGFNPQITVLRNTWQRWRFLNSMSKGFTVVKIVDAATLQATTACEMMLLAKDGVFLMQIPRRIDGMLLSAANRAEVLVRCNAAPGSRFYLWAGDSMPFSSNTFGDKENVRPDRVFRHLYMFTQDPLATIIVQEAPESRRRRRPPGPRPPSVLTRDLTARACTPRRPHYSADLRNANLVSAGYSPAAVVNYTTGFRGLRLPGNLPQSDFLLYACGIFKPQLNDYTTWELPDPYPLTLTLGKIMQWDFKDFEFHPMHTHINPFQLQEIDTSRLCVNAEGVQSCFTAGYFEAGDWGDTLSLPIYQTDGTTELPTPVRYQPGEYSGFTVMHCHFLHHEDFGCMTVVWYRCPSKPDNAQGGDCPGFSWPVLADVNRDGSVVPGR